MKCDNNLISKHAIQFKIFFSFTRLGELSINLVHFLGKVKGEKVTNL